MNSRRLPGKVLKKICEKPILEILIDRLRHSKKINDTIIATSKSKKDIQIVNFCKKKKINFFRGSEKNVLKRLVQTGEFYKATIIVQLTGDNPFIDPEMIDYMINFFVKRKKIDYLTNNGLGNFKFRSVPIGLDVQIYYFKHLKKIFKLAKRKDLKEHPSLYFYREGKKKFKLHNIILPKKFYIDKSYRLTLDEHEDYLLLKKIYSYFKKIKNIMFNVKDISLFLKKNPELTKINEKIPQKIVRIKI